MKKKVLVCLLTAISISVSAQQLRYGVIGGADLSSNKHYSSRLGFHVGAKMEMDASFIGKGVFFDTSLMMIQKGMKNSWATGTYGVDTDLPSIEVSGSETLTPTYLQLSLHAGYKFSVGNAVSLFVKGGPYAAIGMFGNHKIKWETYDGMKGSDKEGVFKNTMNRFDWGLGFRVGTEFLNHYQISVGHDWGLKAFDKNSNLDIKHQTLTFSFAYMF